MPGTWWAVQPPLQVPLPADGARGTGTAGHKGSELLRMAGQELRNPSVPAQQIHLIDCCNGAGGVTSVPRGCCGRAVQ